MFAHRSVHPGQINRAIVPVLAHGHYILLHIGRDSKNNVHVHIIDSLLKNSEDCIVSDDQARTIGSQLFGVAEKAVKTARATQGLISKQINGIDCGPHMILNVEACLREPKFNSNIKRLGKTGSSETITAARQRIRKELEAILQSRKGVTKNLHTSKKSTETQPTTEKIVGTEKSAETSVKIMKSTEPTLTIPPKTVNIESNNQVCTSNLPPNTEEKKQQENDSRLTTWKQNFAKSGRNDKRERSDHGALKPQKIVSEKKQLISIEPNSETKTTSSVISHIDEVLATIKDRNEMKALKEARQILQRAIQPQQNKSSTSSEESSEYSPQKFVKKERRLLTEEEKKKVVEGYFSKATTLRELIRLYDLPLNKKVARVHIARIAKELDSGTLNRHQAYRRLNERVESMLDYADEVAMEDIHERDIQTLGVQQSVCFGLHAFRGSRHWVQNVKKRMNFVSRKIDKRIARVKRSNSPTLQQKIASFKIANISQIRKDYPPERMFNVDQTGVNYEMAGKRTLTKRGRNKVHRIVQRLNATKQSFTLNPCISASGHLTEKTFLTLREPYAPKTFRRMVAPFPQLYVTHTRSGMMNSNLCVEWLLNVFLPCVPDNSILMLDSWGGFRRMINHPEVKRRQLKIVVFPKKTTGDLQPLDISWNRQFKTFVRTLETRIRNKRKRLTIAMRKTQLEIIRFTMDQLRAERFRGLGQRGFEKLGVIDNHTPYETPADYCFSVLHTAKKICSSCTLHSFVRCAHENCTETFCARCALNHLHN